MSVLRPASAGTELSGSGRLSHIQPDNRPASLIEPPRQFACVFGVDAAFDLKHLPFCAVTAEEIAGPEADDGLTLASGARVTSKPEGLFNRNGSMESGTAFSCVYDITDASFTMGPEDLHYASVQIEMRAGDNGCLPFEAETGRPQVIKLTTKAKTGVGITSPRDGFAITKLLTTATIDGVEAEFEMSCVMERSDETHKMQCGGGMPVSQWLPDDSFGDEQLRFSAGAIFVL